MNFFNRLIIFLLVVQLSGCGTLLYPERRGLKGGRIDGGVAILDGLGLLLFLIPGIIAFAVDFSSGCIYLPDRSASKDGAKKNTLVVKIDPAQLNEKKIEEIVSQHAGRPIHLRRSDTKAYSLESPNEIDSRLAELN